MGHHHLDTLNLKNLHLLETAAQARPVHVTMHSTKNRGDGLQAVGQLITADVAGMPHLITVSKVLYIAVVPPCMRITDDAYLFHDKA